MKFLRFFGWIFKICDFEDPRDNFSPKSCHPTGVQAPRLRGAWIPATGFSKSRKSRFLKFSVALEFSRAKIFKKFARLCVGLVWPDLNSVYLRDQVDGTPI